jgi:hypothetical protein
MLNKLTHCIAEKECSKSWTWVKCRICAYVLLCVLIILTVFVFIPLVVFK